MMTAPAVLPIPSPEAFKSAMRGFAGACSLITVGQGEAATGLVVTSGVSLTAEPPMVLACINRTSSSWPLLQSTGVFGWSALGAGHRAVAERFSGFGGLRGPVRYDGADWTVAADGTRLLADAPLAFACAVDEMMDRGTHSILIGRVLQIQTLPGQGGLIYWNGTYRPLAG
jgi:flavin reductase (DIM6/NTAB) family NADH-FMN oxidoreductase RutF